MAVAQGLALAMSESTYDSSKVVVIGKEGAEGKKGKETKEEKGGKDITGGLVGVGE